MLPLCALFEAEWRSESAFGHSVYGTSFTSLPESREGSLGLRAGRFMTVSGSRTLPLPSAISQ